MNVVDIKGVDDFFGHRIIGTVIDDNHLSRRKVILEHGPQASFKILRPVEGRDDDG